jgi:hypothetical protein
MAFRNSSCPFIFCALNIFSFKQKMENPTEYNREIVFRFLWVLPVSISSDFIVHQQLCQVRVGRVLLGSLFWKVNAAKFASPKQKLEQILRKKHSNEIKKTFNFELVKIFVFAYFFNAIKLPSTVIESF